MYLLQFDRLILIKGVLQCQTYAQDKAEFHQLVLPREFRPEFPKMLHDDQGHQAIERTLSLLHENFYWSTMYADTTSWVSKLCNRCKIAKGLIC